MDAINKPHLLRPTKIVLFGRPGSGKTHTALKLSKLLNLPLFHLDKYFFTANWQKRNQHEFLQDLHMMIVQKTWIIDGNNVASLELRYQAADLVIYFNRNRLFCILRLLQRFLLPNSKIDDRALACKEKISIKLLKYLWEFKKTTKNILNDLKNKYPKPHFVEIKNSKELAALLKLII